MALLLGLLEPAFAQKTALIKTQNENIQTTYDPITGLTTTQANLTNDLDTSCKDNAGLIVKFKSSANPRIKFKSTKLITTNQSSEALTEQEVKNFLAKKKIGKNSKPKIEKLIKDDDLDKLEQKVLKTNIKYRSKAIARFNKFKSLRKKHNIENIFVVKLNDCSEEQNAIQTLKQDALIEYAEENKELKTSAVDDDFYQSNGQYWNLGYDELWGLKQIKADKAWHITQGEGVVVAVVDTGVDYNHPDLWYNIWVNPEKINDVNNDGLINLDDVDLNHNKYIENNEIVADMFGKDFISGDTNPIDEHGHGTHVAGTIAATANNATGIVGVAPKAKILPIQILSKSGSGPVSTIAQGINYLSSLTVSNPELANLVTNNSYGAAGYSQTLANAFKLATDMGIINVVAAGNSNSDASNYTPAGLDTVITVGASGYNSKRASFSNFGNIVDVAAPGGGDNSSGSQSNILSTISLNSELLNSNSNYKINDPDRSNYVYAKLAGTSMASPHVAGVAALIKSQHPEFNFSDVRDIISNTARTFTQDPGKPIGKGIVDAEAAININNPYPDVAILNLESSISGNYTFSLSVKKSLRGAEISSKELAWSYDQTNWQTIPIIENGSNLIANFNTTQVKQADIFFRLSATDTLGQLSRDIQKTTVSNFELTKPLAGDLTNKFDPLTIKANFKTSSIKGFHIVYSNEANGEWQESASTIDSNKIGEIFNDEVIGSIDISKLESDKIYKIKLVIEFDSDVIAESEPVKIYIDSKMKKGFPIYSKDKSALVRSDSKSVLSANINNDPELEIIKIFQDSADNPDYSTNILKAFKANGQELWSKSFNYMNNLQVFDADNNEISEIYFTAYNLTKSKYELYALDGSGTLKTNFPLTISGSLINMRNIDIDKDDKAEIIAINNSDSAKNSFLIIDPLSGTIKYNLDPNPSIAPLETGHFSLANLDSDQDLEFVYHTGSFAYTRLAAVNLDGSSVTGWSTNWNSNQISLGNIASADLDNDGFDEIISDAGQVMYRDITGPNSGSYSYYKRAALVDHNGSLKNNQLLEANADSDYVFIDLDNDNNKEVIFGARKIYAFNKDGLAINNWPWTLISDSIRSSNYENKVETITIDDINQDKNPDFIMAYAGLGSLFYSSSSLSNSAGIFAFDTKQNLLDLNNREDSTVLPLGSTGNLKASGVKFESLAGRPLISDLENNNFRDILIARDYEYSFKDAAALENNDAFLKPRAAIYAWEIPANIPIKTNPPIDPPISNPEPPTPPVPTPPNTPTPPATNKVPKANFNFSPDSPEIGSDISFDASSSSDEDGTIVSYTWDFDNDGITDAKGKTVIHSFSNIGDFSVSLTVADNKGAKNSISKTVTVKDIVKPIDPKEIIEPSFTLYTEQGQPLTSIYKLKAKKPTVTNLYVYKTNPSATQSLGIWMRAPNIKSSSLVKSTTKIIGAHESYSSLKLQLKKRSAFKKAFPNQSSVDIPITITDVDSGYTLNSFIKVYL